MSIQREIFSEGKTIDVDLYRGVYKEERDSENEIYVSMPPKFYKNIRAFIDSTLEENWNFYYKTQTFIFSVPSFVLISLNFAQFGLNYTRQR